jgi:hypothetical protein
MRKTAYAPILVLALLFSAEAQVVMVLANPRYPSPYGYPEIAITAPAISNPQNDVWLNLTITKPSNWTDYYEGHITNVAYLIDGSRERLIGASPDNSVGITWVAVDDPVGVANQQTEVNVSIKLEGLSEGNHHVNVAVWGVVMDGEVWVANVGKINDHTIYFIVTGESTPSPTPTLAPTATPTATPEAAFQSATFPTNLFVLSSAGIALGAAGILVYFKKLKH